MKTKKVERQFCQWHETMETPAECSMKLTVAMPSKQSAPQIPTPTPMVMDAQAVFKLCQDHAALQAENAKLREALEAIRYRLKDYYRKDGKYPDIGMTIADSCVLDIAIKALARPQEVK